MLLIHRAGSLPRRSRLAALLTASLASGVAAHPNTASDAVPALTWSLEPWVVACLMISGGLYLLGLRRLWRRSGPGAGVHGRRALAFACGWLATAAALVSPLDGLGSDLFSAHMLQHEVLMVVAAPLYVLGRPLGVWAWALPPAWRRQVGRLFHRTGWRRPWLFVTGPIAAWSIHALALWLWHIPALFQAALANQGIHALQHASFLLSALLYWWSVMGVGHGRNGGAAMLSLFTTMIHTGALGALLTLSPIAWYPAYSGRALAFGLDPLEDQQLGGLVMWIPAGLAYVACGLTSALHWLNRRTKWAPTV